MIVTRIQPKIRSIVFSIASLVLFSSMSSAFGQNADDAFSQEPIVRTAPQFPEQCVKGRKAAFETYVELEFTIAADGTVENILVIETSDKCFNESAVQSVSEWKYAPVMVDGLPVRVEHQKTRVTFQFYPSESNYSKYTPLQAGSPVLVLTSQVPPKFPYHCLEDRAVAYEAHVDFEFDVTAKGRVENVRVLEASDDCFVETSKKAVLKWKYKRPIVDGESTPVNGEKIRVQFRYPGASSGRQVFSAGVAKQLSLIFKKMQEDDHEGALLDLDQLLLEKRATMSPYELATTLELRGAVKYDLGDLEGARSDFEDARSLNILPAARQKQLDSFVEQISAELAQREASSSIDE